MNAPLRKSDPTDARLDELHEELDRLIFELTQRAPLNGLAKLQIDGFDFQADRVTPERVMMPIADPEALPAVRNTSTAPLEFLFHKARNPIELWQYAAGCRYRLDWTAAQISTLGAVDYGRSAIFATEAFMLAVAKGWEGKGTGAALRSYTGISDRKLDAMKRLGDAASAVGPLFSQIAWWVLGEERSVRQVALAERIDERVARALVDLTLTELARHYGLTHAAKHPPRNRR